MSLPTTLKLVDGSPHRGYRVLGVLHFLLAFVALLIKLPFYLLYHYVLFRNRSTLVKIGRNPLAEVINHVAKEIFNNFPLSGSRAVFATQLFLRRDKWIERITTDEGVKGVWIRRPGTDRRDDDLVLYFLHGGAFNHDIVGASLPFYKSLVLDLNQHPENPRRFSLFVLDYHLAPEKIYPSQLIELEAGYRYLTQTLGIEPERICLGGDSAGGNLVSSFLLHLVKPNPRLGHISPPLEKPGSVLLMSPWTSLLPLASRPSRTSSAHAALDFLMTPAVTLGAYQYLGLEAPFAAGPSWNPLKWFGILQDEMPHLENENEINGAFDDPYLSPGPETVGKQDWDWYRKAFPGEGKTCVIWGGMEIFADDIEAFVGALKSVGMNPVKIYHAEKCHDWPLFDYTFPFLSQTKTGGESSKFDFGLKEMAAYLRSVSIVDSKDEKY
ncbi:alpha/beta hydrolase [Sporobolomyces salmoneus]|uniref:alpha/beta hydrolase n=1 Tax=Sporobolomyces salmoneus TaxID=183962 RepID=UPI003179EBF8